MGRSPSPTLASATRTPRPIGRGNRFQSLARPPVSSRALDSRHQMEGPDQGDPAEVITNAKDAREPGRRYRGSPGEEEAPRRRARRPGSCRADLSLKESLGHGRIAVPGSGIDLVESVEKSQDTTAIGRSVLTGIIISWPVRRRDRHRGETKEWGGSCPGPDRDGPPPRRRRRSRAEGRGKIDPRWHRHQRGGTNGPLRGR